MIAIWVAAAVVLLAFIILLSLFLNARKDLRQANKYFDDQVHKTTEASVKYNRQLEVRNDAIKKLLRGQYAPETITFFTHLTDPSSHIPDNIFEKVDAYQGFISKKKKEE